MYEFQIILILKSSSLKFYQVDRAQAMTQGKSLHEVGFECPTSKIVFIEWQCTIHKPPPLNNFGVKCQEQLTSYRATKILSRTLV